MDSNPRSHLKEEAAELHLFDSAGLLSNARVQLGGRASQAPDEVGPRVRLAPLLHISCESEGPLVMTAGHEFYKKLTFPKTEHVVRSVDGGEAHRKIEFDWLDGVFK